MKLAIVHDYLTQKGGAERVVLAMCEAFPDAPVFTSIYSPAATFSEFKQRKVNVTYLQGAYRFLRNYRLLLPFYPAAFQSIDLENFDVILSSSSAFASCIKKSKGAVHICYCHNPARFIWMKEAYLKEERLSILKRMYLAVFLPGLKQHDLNAARNVNCFIANSSTVQDRIKKAYGRNSDIIHPPVDCAKFSISDKNGGYYLIVSRLMAHKRIDMAIKVFNALSLKLKIVGSGPQFPVLKNMSSGNISFLGSVGEKELVRLYSQCAALIYPQEEDFGIAPLEANASGRPVIAFAKGGVLETMEPCDEMHPDGTAVFFYRQTPEDLAEAVKKFSRLKFNPQRLRDNALLFDKSVFISKLKAKINEMIKSKGKII